MPNFTQDAGYATIRQSLVDDLSSAVRALEEAVNDFGTLTDTLVGSTPTPPSKESARISGSGVFDQVRTDAERVRSLTVALTNNLARIRGAL